MIPKALSAALSTLLPAVDLHPRAHRRGAHPDAATHSSKLAGPSAGSLAQMPLGAAPHLFANMMHSLEQSAAAQSKASVPK